VGFSGADLANLVNEAAILAARRGKTTITADEFGESIDRVIAGPQRKSRIISPREKEITAFHEAGHALVGHLLPDADPVTKISIVSRGQMGGYTRFAPEEERTLATKKQLIAQLAVALGGRSAEEVQFSQITTGASNDLEQATSIARAMVTQLGMSEKLGPRTFGKREEMVFLGREFAEQKDYSNEVAEQIDDEIHSLIDEAHSVARRLLAANKAKLTQIARYLMEYESVEEQALEQLLSSPTPDIPLPVPAD
jgi:cell division protease FtsH